VDIKTAWDIIEPYVSFIDAGCVEEARQTLKSFVLAQLSHNSQSASYFSCKHEGTSVCLSCSSNWKDSYEPK
jgi:hypothetical protein